VILKFRGIVLKSGVSRRQNFAQTTALDLSFHLELT